jgi:hypothetical protein
MMKNRTKTTLVLNLLLGISLLLSACSKPTNATPTLDPVLIRTQAVATFSIGLTQTALAQPTATPTETPSPTPTETSTPAPSSTTSLVILPTSSCNVLSFVSDVNIPDNSKMAPDQKFTKTWRVKNSGTCDWEEDFQVKFFSGNAMGGKSIALGKTVAPGQEVNLSVNLIAPTAIGVYTGNWRMTDDSGAFFGDSFYVMISVATGSSASATVSAPAPTATVEPAPSATPE